MNSSSPPSSSEDSFDAIEDAAAAWLARRYGGLSKAESAVFDKWLAEDPRHAAAVARLERVWTTLSSPAQAGQGERAEERMDARDRFRSRRRRQANVVMAGLAAAAIVVVVMLNFPVGRQPVFSPSHGIALRPDIQSLPDGSTVQLNAGAEVALAFTPSARTVHLLRGEVLFEVARDTSRPFVVSAGGIQVKALGTAFAVRFSPENVDIIVTKGSVAVERDAASAPSITLSSSLPTTSDSLQLTAGERSVLLLSNDDAMPSVSRLTPAEIAFALAWCERRIEFTQTPLSEAVERFNSQNRPRLVVADEQTGNFEISGIFWADDPDAFVRLLETAFGMNVERSSERIIVRIR